MLLKLCLVGLDGLVQKLQQLGSGGQSLWGGFAPCVFGTEFDVRFTQGIQPRTQSLDVVEPVEFAAFRGLKIRELLLLADQLLLFLLGFVLQLLDAFEHRRYISRLRHCYNHLRNAFTGLGRGRRRYMCGV